ncbi:uncharacterized protein PHALS_15289 [Plasmopara halstedii]|uniref:Uncharacterized protein n=1 Tax=Plasmopara halstedii TaxID=4781 RepID=A0A0P1AC79_PLAHL|nr:uncharacterized protein PHALS_15289 [Plasmopara halstedii]CEG38088.1 hypothetical protein PHALS_15289 [Plasmopara halstedii]|eukprot:XP_024574457.1 hypothetical protein PHALS_15289 [Plasmopara halstedii]
MRQPISRVKDHRMLCVVYARHSRQLFHGCLNEHYLRCISPLKHIYQPEMTKVELGEDKKCRFIFYLKTVSYSIALFGIQTSVSCCSKCLRWRLQALTGVYLPSLPSPPAHLLSQAYLWCLKSVTYEFWIAAKSRTSAVSA